MTRQDAPEAVVSVEGLGVRFGRQWVLRDVDLEVRRGEFLALVGSSGTGKTTTMQCILGLRQPDEGTVRVLGHDVHCTDMEHAHALRLRWGVLFQRGALFGALRVFDNVAFPLRELRVVGRDIEEDAIYDLVMLKLKMVGLKPRDAWKVPAELSGGMVKRAALARALALDPDILFLDEPTSGLDPDSATELDSLLGELHEELHVSALMITHDLNSMAALSDRIAVMDEGRILTAGQLEQVAAYDHPFVRRFFHGPRGEPLLHSAP